MNNEPDNRAGKPKARWTGRPETIVAGKKYVLRVFLGRDAAGKRHYHSETFHGTAAGFCWLFTSALGRANYLRCDGRTSTRRPGRSASVRT